MFLLSYLVLFGKALKPIAKPLRKEEGEILSRERYKIKFVDVRFGNRQVVGLWGGRKKVRHSIVYKFLE